MKGLKTIARKSQNINQRDRSTWIKLYYDFSTDTVSMKATKNNCMVTQLINPNTEEDIKEAVERWKRL
jgi:hypothetical protein